MHPFRLFPQMQIRDIYIMGTASVMMFIADMLAEQGKWERIKEKTPFIIRDLIYIFMFFSLILFADTGIDITRNFIYANF